MFFKLFSYFRKAFLKTNMGTSCSRMKRIFRIILLGLFVLLHTLRMQSLIND